jgi:hypothetical protein
MKHRAASIIIVITILLIGTVSAGVFSINDAKATITIKPISSDGQISKGAVLEKDLKTDILQAVKLELTKDATVETKTLQMYPGSSFLISDDFSGSTNVMQTSTKEGYPLIEVYYGYQKSRFEPWQYYFRIEKIDKDNAYVIYGDFSKRSVWLGAIPRSAYDTMISSGKIPDWESVK